MGELELFSFGSHQVRVISQDEMPWWVARDVCNVLEIQNASQALETLDDDEKRQASLGLSTGYGKRDQAVNIINESGLYSLILRSRKPEAKAFKRWITQEVLPSIRSTGGYGVSQPNPVAWLSIVNECIAQSDRISSLTLWFDPLNGVSRAKVNPRKPVVPMIERDPWSGVRDENIYPVEYSSGKRGGVCKPFVRLPENQAIRGNEVRIALDDGSRATAKIVGSFSPITWRGETQAYINLPPRPANDDA